ncbi:MAG: glycoside hydrolase family 2 protein [Flavobacteriales bacterium]|nr:glycoside hydrolase family 2 protein [Flavobacteriales bacterium]
MKTAVTLVVLLAFLSCHQEQRLLPNFSDELAIDWVFSEEGDTNSLPAIVPGSVHLDLLNNRIIEDPYFEQNELKLRWIEEKNWVYHSVFKLDEHYSKQQHIEFDFEGLDTYAKVYLNDSLILTANNMFRSWQVEVKALLKTGQNTLRIHFESPILHHRKAVQNYPHVLPSGSETMDIESKVSNFTRKAAYHFGWDWGPRFVSSGIWKAIQINTWNSARILDIYTSTQSIDQEKARLLSEIKIEVDKAGLYEFKIDSITIKEQLKKGINYIKRSFEVIKPKLWWCNGLGEQHMYHQSISISYKNNQIATHKNSYGIRTIELINEPDSIGTSFYFKLNGQPVFMKGANYIPQDLFLTRVSNQQYENLIQSAKEANMNMLRVWGGGIYEKDIFYDLCDQNGILVWQDFMFAGSLYPDIRDLKENIKEEVKENVIRLRQHPSIALWCGNNEIEVAWNNWGWQKQYGYSSEDSIAIWKNNKAIFHELIPNELAKYDSERNYTPTSPLSNWGTAENFNHGSMHYWGVWHGREPFKNFERNVGRFMVEYGFQSFPSIETLSKNMDDSSLYLNSVAMRHRQKSYIGNGLILQHIEQYYDSASNFEDFVRLSQETQAKGLKMAIEAHINKQAHCMGSLFWQLNDCWPGPSWSVIDYYGNKKTAYKAVQEGFSQ